MRWYYKLPLRLRSLFRKDKAEIDLSEELQFHLQNQIDEYVAQGMDPRDARHAAFRSLGGVEQVKEECRNARRVNWIHDLGQDGCRECRSPARMGRVARDLDCLLACRICCRDGHSSGCWHTR